MPTVIIPHPTEMLELVREQKRIIREFNTINIKAGSMNGCLLLPLYPLWCILDNSGLQKLNIQKTVQAFRIDAPEIQKHKIIFPCLCTLSEGTVSGTIAAAVFNRLSYEGKNTTDRNGGTVMEAHRTFSLSCRVFRLGTAIIEPSAWRVTEESWIKTNAHCTTANQLQEQVPHCFPDQS